MKRKVAITDENDITLETQRQDETCSKQQSPIEGRPHDTQEEIVNGHRAEASEPSANNSTSAENEDIRRELNRRRMELLAQRRELEMECNRVLVERMVLLKFAQSIDASLTSLQEQDVFISSNDTDNQ